MGAVAAASAATGQRGSVGLLVVAIALAATASAEARPWSVTDARFSEPTTRYDHAVLGDAIEYGAMALRVADVDAATGTRVTARTVIRLPPDRVFEDVAPRLADLDGDGRNDIVVVETDLVMGASLSVYDAYGRIAQTPFIGQPNRWLAPAGIGDFDGDGRPEIAYVDRPHLVRDLVFVRLDGDRLVELARIGGFSNHRIGDRSITSAVRTCGQAAEVLLPDAGWTRLMAVRLSGGRIVARDVGPLPATFPAAVPACP